MSERERTSLDDEKEAENILQDVLVDLMTKNPSNIQKFLADIGKDTIEEYSLASNWGSEDPYFIETLGSIIDRFRITGHIYELKLINWKLDLSLKSGPFKGRLMYLRFLILVYIWHNKEIDMEILRKLFIKEVLFTCHVHNIQIPPITKARLADELENMQSEIEQLETGSEDWETMRSKICGDAHPRIAKRIVDNIQKKADAMFGDYLRRDKGEFREFLEDHPNDFEEVMLRRILGIDVIEIQEA